MLLKLEHPVQFNDAVAPICLPSLFQVLPGGKPCYSSGWGQLSSRTRFLSELHLPINQLISIARKNFYLAALYASEVYIIMAARWNRTGHYIFAPVVSSSIFLSIFLSFSPPNLSRRRLDIYQTSTHGVALVRI